MTQYPEQPAAAAAAAPAPLAPPAGMPAASLSLDAPAPIAQVVETQAPKMAPPVSAEQVPVLEAKVEAFVAAIGQAQPKSPEMDAQAAAVRSMGDADIRRAAETSNRLLKRPVKEMDEGALSGNSQVGKTLLDLRRTIEDLDPSQATGTRKLLGILPFGDRIVDYFRRYQDAEKHLNGILHSLQNGRDELAKDNVALNMEKQNLWQAMGRLNQYIYIAERLDARISEQISALELSDPERAKTLSADVLFYVRQKHQDLLTQLAVSVQSYLAIDIIIKNNIELMKGVDRASTTTVSALRTAIIVSQALTSQELVLNQISALNTTTSGLIQRTSEQLKINSAKIHEGAASATIGLPQLQAAFQNIYDTMDSIDDFKARALDSMGQTITVLSHEVEKSEAYLARVAQHDERLAAGALDVEGGGPDRSGI
ncbi:toxic anion resistance protein [Naumannella halotolerans]|uniref:toxic anion resistance protein n=1 Tax=Naumannella halotolerans TaxID=993414 RepID=UPI00370D141D